MSSSKKKPKRRKTFKLPHDGPLHDPVDDLAAVPPADLLDESPALTEAELKAQHLEMVRNVLAFDRLVWRAFKTVLLSILFFGVGTSVAGGLIGFAFPNYCRLIFNAFDRVDFQPWIGGLAGGLIGGSLAGAVIGCVVVFSVAMYQSRAWKNID